MVMETTPGVSGAWRSALRAVVACGTLAILLVALSLASDAGRFYGTPAGTGTAPPLDLTTDGGQRFDLDQLRGRVALIYFGYTGCPDICPTTLFDLANVADRLGPERAKVAIIFVTLDPARDTPAVIRQYLASFDQSFVGLTGTAADIAAASRSWGITRRFSDNREFLDHTSVVSLVDPQGRLRARYSYSQIGDAASVAADVRSALMGPGG